VASLGEVTLKGLTMPTKKEIVVYQYDELSDEAQDNARKWYRESALAYDWWDSIYDDAKNIGLKITAFDLGRRNSIEGAFTKDAKDVADAILANHGEIRDTYRDATVYTKYRKAIIAAAPLSAIEEETDDYLANALEELDKGFLHAILQDYLSMLRRETEYLESDECITESIRANDYEFLESGRRYAY
jgi:hypothetical protein